MIETLIAAGKPKPKNRKTKKSVPVKKKATKKSKRSKASRSKIKKDFFHWGLLVKVFLVLFLVVTLVLAFMDATIREKFEGRRWSIPAKVYARSLELYEGKRISQEQLVFELSSLSYKKQIRASEPGTYSIYKNKVDLYSRGFRFWDKVYSAQAIRLTFSNTQLVKLSTVGGGDGGGLRLEPALIGGIYPAHNEDRLLIKLSQTPNYLTEALVSVEDKQYFNHYGISIKGILRALWVNVSSGELRQGGSTLTQQLVKNFYLTNDRTLLRKLIEIPMSLLLELHYSKQDILETYLNEVYLGQDGGRAIHGFGLASEFYFKQPLSELDLHQVALLVGLVKGPSYYDPRRRPERAKQRRDLVIDVLFEEHLISKREAINAKAQSLSVVSKAAAVNLNNPAFLGLVRKQLQRDYRFEDLISKGLRIFTTLDPFVQKKSEQQMAVALKALGQRYGKDKLAMLQSAVVVTRPKTGEVLAVIGDKNPGYAGFNRALSARRPIGSLVKPAIYLGALEGGNYHVLSPVSDAPYATSLPDGSYWEPRNFDKVSHGKKPLHRVSMLDALSNSYNLAAVNLGLDVGVENVVNVLERLGVARELEPYPSLLLGSGELTPIEVALAYQTLAAGGVYHPLKAIREILDADGDLKAQYPVRSERRFSEEDAYLIDFMMQKTMRTGTGKTAYNKIATHINLAGKTGTSNGSRDSWFAGYSENYMAVVWLGFDDNRKTPLTGGTGALQVWASIMAKLQLNSLNKPLPSGLESVWMDSHGEKMSARHCMNSVSIPIRGNLIPESATSCANVSKVGKKVRSWFERMMN